ncbi:MAG: MFS transporter [Alicyclobacillaceae bacterium]|nr:MFS transporter [Alicyclobacillaceae bacterium]
MPVTRTAVGIVVLLSLVWLAEAFDIGIVGPVLSALKDSWHLTESQMGLLAASSTAGVVMGMIPSGVIADRFGRRRLVLLGIAVFSLITLAGSFATTVWQLCLIRFFAGLGEGAVIPMPYLFLAEFVRTKRRAVSVGYSNGVLTAAYLIPSLAAHWALGAFDPAISWRVPFLLGGIPLLLLIPLFLWLPESPRFLLKRGRREDVRRLVERLERQAGLPHDTTLVNRRALMVIQKGEVEKPTIRQLLRQPYLGRGLVVSAQLTGALILFYILQVYGPTILIQRGFQSGNAILFSGLMMGVAGLGSVAQGYLADRYGRRRVLIVYFLLAGIGAAVFGLAAAPALLAFAAFLTSFFGLGVFPVSKLTVSEQFPTRLRGKGVYLSESVARTLSGVVTLYFIPVLLNLWGSRLIYEGIAIALLALALPFIIWGRETAGISVEEAGTDLSFDRLDGEFPLQPGTEFNL